jgi:hypothetical protein
MKKTQISFPLLNSSPHFWQLGANLQNVLYRRAALQNRQILRYLGARITQARLSIHVLVGDITNLNSVLLDCLSYGPHLRTRHQSALRESRQGFILGFGSTPEEKAPNAVRNLKSLLDRSRI